MEFAGDTLLFKFESLSAARFVSSKIKADAEFSGRLFHRFGLNLFASIGNRTPVELFPDPSLLVRLLSPQVRKMAAVRK